MFYYLYEIRNTLNGKIYVGVHKTRNMDDGYMGSGKVLQNAILKHGIENFTKVILETFENVKTMYVREKEVVTEEFILREDTYNLRRGGDGGFDYINKHGFNREGAVQQSKNMTQEERTERARLAGKASWLVNKVSLELATEAAKTSEAIEKRKATFKKIGHQKGEKNSNFGTCWIKHKTYPSKRIIKELLPEYLEQGWIKGRRMVK